jgi:hypothetical protein
VEQVQAEWTKALGEKHIRDLLETLRELAGYLNEPLGASGRPVSLQQAQRINERATGKARDRHV